MVAQQEELSYQAISQPPQVGLVTVAQADLSQAVVTFLQHKNGNMVLKKDPLPLLRMKLHEPTVMILWQVLSACQSGSNGVIYIP